MKKRRSADGFNLAFLDVMACGLGAIVLILMLVKFNATSETPTDELERLQTELTELQNQSASLEKTIATTEKNLSEKNTSLADSQQRVQQLSQQQGEASQALNNQRAVLADVEKALAAAAPRQADDNISLQGQGEENYLLGLKVEGKHIGILMDSSASMTDETLINIIRRKISSDSEKKAGPKWQRTKRVVRWLLARVPQSSNVSVVSFSDTASKVGARSIVPASSQSGITQLSSAIDQIIPQNGTNLQLALDEIQERQPNLTDLYIVTDGLPTLGKRDKSLSSLANCTSLFGKAKTITGECRLRLFYYSVKQANMNNITINVILLPLEGDPDAAQAYWNWTASTGGLFITPADSWP